jgi:hypothetical protein
MLPGENGCRSASNADVAAPAAIMTSGIGRRRMTAALAHSTSPHALWLIPRAIARIASARPALAGIADATRDARCSSIVSRTS